MKARSICTCALQKFHRRRRIWVINGASDVCLCWFQNMHGRKRTASLTKLLTKLLSLVQQTWSLLSGSCSLNRCKQSKFLQRVRLVHQLHTISKRYIPISKQHMQSINGQCLNKRNGPLSSCWKSSHTPNWHTKIKGHPLFSPSFELHNNRLSLSHLNNTWQGLNMHAHYEWSSLSAQRFTQPLKCDSHADNEWPVSALSSQGYHGRWHLSLTFPSLATNCSERSGSDGRNTMHKQRWR